MFLLVMAQHTHSLHYTGGMSMFTST